MQVNQAVFPLVVFLIGIAALGTVLKFQRHKGGGQAVPLHLGGVLLGVQIISLIPASFVSALTFLVPALYGAMLMQMVLYTPKIALISVPLGIITLIISKTGLFDSSVAIIISVFGSIFIGRLLMKTGWLDD